MPRRAPRPAQLASVIAAIAVVMAGCQSESEEPSPSDPPSTTTSPATSSPEATATGSTGPRESSVLDLAVGECFVVDTDAIATVVLVDCAEEHLYETFALLEYPGGAADPFPGDQAVRDFADNACQAPFEAFVGHEYQTSIWFITTLPPSEATWADGDREIVCTLNQQDAAGDPVVVTGSAEGAGD